MKNVESKAKRNYSVPNLERGMHIMELLGGHPEGMSMVEIAEKLGYPNNSVFRIASSLTELGYLYRCPKSKRFSLTRKFLTLAYSTVHEYNIVEKSITIMRKLRDKVGETVLLGTMFPEEAKLVVMAQAASSYPFGFQIKEGTMVDLHASAPGKAFLAYLPAAELEELLDLCKYKKYTETTITGKRQMRKELEKIQQCGYAIDDEEMVKGCHCVSVPVFDENNYPIAAIWATGPIDRFPAAEFPKIGETMREYSAAITEQLLIVSE